MAKRLTRSSAGFFFFSSTSFAKYVNSSIIAWRPVALLSVPGTWYSGSPAPIVRFVQSNSSFQSDRGTPSSHAITAIGSGADDLLDEVHLALVAGGEQLVDDLLAMRSMSGCQRLSAPGVKRFETILR